MSAKPPLVVLVLGGVAERWNCPEEHSALASAATPHLDRLAETGRVFGARLIGPDEDPAGAAPLLALLGYDPREVECALSSYLGSLRGIALAAEECFVCAEFVALFRDTLADVEPGPLRPAEVEVLLREAAAAVQRAGFRLVEGEGSHHLAVAPRAAVDPAVPHPERMVGRSLSTFQPAREQHAFAHRLARETLDGHEINEVRRDLGENGADMIWFWGPGGAGRLPEPFPAPAAALGSDLGWKGVCSAAGIPLRAPAAKTPAQLLRAIGQSIRREEICLVHVARGVRDARLRELSLRVEGLEEIDAQLVGPVAETVARAGGRLLVLSDTPRDTESGCALAEPVPVLLWGKGIEPLRPRPFTEAGAASGGDPLEPGHGLLAYVRHL